VHRLLCEVHEEYATNINLALQGYWVYDFALPLLILHAFTFKTMNNLKHWLEMCPRRQITVLDTHDGMGIDDIAGLAEVPSLPTWLPALLMNMTKQVL
jgi:sucrose phosphorylase